MRLVRHAWLLLLPACLVLAQSGSQGPPEPKAPKSFDLSAIDKSVDPCSDFYQYACGNWRKNNPIPPDQVRWNRFNELRERNDWLLYQELETASRPSPTRTSLQQKYGDFYGACMDTALADEKGGQPAEPALKQIDLLEDKRGLAPLLAKLQMQYGTSALFGFGVQQDEKDSSRQIAGTDQGGLGLPDRDYYLAQNPRQQKIREDYVAHITKTFELAGDPPERAAAEAKDATEIETALAEASLTRTVLRDPKARYHIMTVVELDHLMPSFDWEAYFEAIGIGKFDTLNVAEPTFFKALNTEIDSRNLPAWKSYLRWHVLLNASPWLSKAFVDQNFDFYSSDLLGQAKITPRWKRCTRVTDQALGEAVGQDWVKTYFSPEKKQNTLRMVTALEAAMRQDIQQLPWMSQPTREAAVAKLALIRRKIGYPDHWRDYSKLVVERDDLLGNIRRAKAFEIRRNLDKLGKPVDESEWEMTPPTVNAYYEPSLNDINFPAGILQPPFYDFSQDPAVNFGAIGMVIGHEMTHGFDDEGSQYDGHGNLHEWQTPADRKAFTERTDCEVNEYDGFQVAPGQNLNGKLTLGENTADNGGLRIAYLALMDTLAQEGAQAESAKRDGYTPSQRFFIAFAQIWCENVREKSARNGALVDPHSSGKWRVDGVVQNFDEFGKAFGCSKGSPMYPENACRVW